MAWKTVVGWLWSGTKLTARGATGLAYQAKKVVVENKGPIATVVDVGVSIAGHATKAGGKVIRSAAGATAGYAHAGCSFKISPLRKATSRRLC